MLYVAREPSDVLAVVDGATNNLIKNIELSGPYDITINSKTNMIYVTSKIDHSVFVINGINHKLEDSINVQIPCGVAVNTNTNTLYITSEATNKVHVIDGSTNETLGIIDVSDKPRGIAVNEVTNTVCC